jgi:flagellar basal body-associated protein FliL
LGTQAPPPPAQAAPKSSGGRNLAFIAVGALVVLGLCAMVFFMFLRTSGKTATATGTQWERSIEVLALAPVRDTAWRDQVPSGAANLQCRSEVRSTSDQPEPGAKEVCGTPYTVDTGTGMGKVVQDCEYEVYDDMCSFTTQQWTVLTVAKATGAGFNPNWPAVNLVGEQRLGNRSERYVCLLNDGKDDYSFAVSSQDEYEQCEEGTTWKIEVNGFGEVVAHERAQ